MKSFDYPLFAKLARQESTPLRIYNADIIHWHAQQLKSFEAIRFIR